jgi:hypothetical protein
MKIIIIKKMSFPRSSQPWTLFSRWGCCRCLGVRESERKGGREGARERESVCICVCVGADVDAYGAVMKVNTALQVDGVLNVDAES